MKRIISALIIYDNDIEYPFSEEEDLEGVQNDIETLFCGADDVSVVVKHLEE